MKNIFLLIGFLLGLNMMVFAVPMATEKVTLNGYPSAHNASVSYHYDFQSNDRLQDKYRGRIGHPGKRAYNYGVYHQHNAYLPFKTKSPYQLNANHQAISQNDIELTEMES